MSFDFPAKGKATLDVQVHRAGVAQTKTFRVFKRSGELTRDAVRWGRSWHDGVAKELSTSPLYQPVKDGWDLLVTRLHDSDEWHLRVNAPGHDLHDTEAVHPNDMAVVEQAVLGHKQVLDDAHRNGG